MNFLPQNIHPSWNDFLTEEILRKIHEIESHIEKRSKTLNKFILLPAEENVLIFLTRNLFNVKKIWLAQDPYPETYTENGIEKPVANGRAFWPDDAKTWKQPIAQASLRNILRNYYNERYGHESNWRKIRKFTDIREDITSGKIDIKEPPEWFRELEDNGVLMLNTTFTLIKYDSYLYEPNIELWKPFTTELISYILKKVPQAKWCVWGGVAKKATEMIPEEKKQFSAHPSRCTVDKNNFLLNKDIF